PGSAAGPPPAGAGVALLAALSRQRPVVAERPFALGVLPPGAGRRSVAGLPRDGGVLLRDGAAARRPGGTRLGHLRERLVPAHPRPRRGRRRRALRLRPAARPAGVGARQNRSAGGPRKAGPGRGTAAPPPAAAETAAGPRRQDGRPLGRPRAGRAGTS